jgi:hypothetical protein
MASSAFACHAGSFYPTEAKTVNFELGAQNRVMLGPEGNQSKPRIHTNRPESTDFVEDSPESWLFSLTSVSFSPFDGFEAQANAALTAAD